MGGILEQLLALSTIQAIALVTLIFTVACILSVYFSGIRYPANLPRYGEKDGVTSFSLKTRKAYYTDCKNVYKEAYEKVCRASDSKLRNPSLPRTLLINVVLQERPDCPSSRYWLTR
jgi:hypothetical protein